MKVKDIIRIVNGYADEAFAAEWDNSGLQIGDVESSVKNILLCVDITENVIDEAIQNKCELIISHHPLLFRPLSSVTSNDSKGRNIIKLINNDIAVYSSHTCFDVSPHGINQFIASKFKLENIRFLDDWAEVLYKVEVYVPDENSEELLESLYKAGAGAVGNYINCSYALSGEGAFTPLKNASPYIGEENIQSNVHEKKIEILSPKTKIRRIIDTIYETHPYETPVYNISEVKYVGSGIGVGIAGQLQNPIESNILIENVKQLFGTTHIRVSNNYKKKTISKIAFCGGAGSEYIKTAVRMKMDAIITSDCKSNDFSFAAENNIVLICPTHFQSEHCFIDAISNILNTELTEIELFQSKAKDFEWII